MSVRLRRLRRIPATRVSAASFAGSNRTRRPVRHWTVSSTAIVGVALVVGCSGGNETVDSTVATTIATTTIASTTTTLPPPAMFGDLPSPCGPAGDAGTPTIAEGQNSSGALRLGVANDNGFAGAPGSQTEMLDAAEAFAAWCNSQGGLRGLMIEIVDLDAQVTGVPLAMERACAEIFALVGGGWTVDEQMFPRFHECGLVAFPAFTTSAAAGASNGRAQAVPTAIDSDTRLWLDWIESTYPDSVADVAIVHPDLQPTNALADRLAAMMAAVGGFGEPTSIAYDPSGVIDWSDVVQQLADAGIRAVSFIGAPSHLVDLYTAMGSAGYTADVVFGDVQLLSDTVLEGIAAESLANLRIRSVSGLPSEANVDPAMASYIEMLSSLDPPGRAGGLGIASTSSLLFFATAANSCLETNGNVLERECALAQALTISSWTAGGLHAPTDPSSNTPAPCIAVIGVEAGQWTRIHPVRGSSDDDGSGRHCDAGSVVTVDGDFGDISVGIDSTRLN